MALVKHPQNSKISVFLFLEYIILPIFHYSFIYSSLFKLLTRPSPACKLGILTMSVIVYLELNTHYVNIGFDTHYAIVKLDHLVPITMVLTTIYVLCNGCSTPRDWAPEEGTEPSSII